jgi:3-dehydroquinate synthase
LVVELKERTYPIIVRDGALELLGTEASAICRGGPVVCVADERVAALYGQQVEDSLRGSVDWRGWVSVRRGERSKSWAVAGRVLRELAGLGMARDGMVVALGGGVAGDLAGFVAASFARGVDFVQVPTTLLAQVDSSVGGKTGVNLPEGKNLVGAFHQPRLVVCDVLTLSSLPRRELRCGLAEALKHGLIADADYLDRVESLRGSVLRAAPAALEEVVVGSCAIKAKVVAEDERESGRRAILNFGHTIGHALETVAGYRRLRHGEAVAVGMVGAAMLGVRAGTCDKSLVQLVRRCVEAAGLPASAPGLPADEVLAALARDKKAARGEVRWVLPVVPGEVLVTPEVEPRDVRGVVATLVEA